MSGNEEYRGGESGEELQEDARVIIPLTKPLRGHRGEICELSLREPDYSDIIECGDLTRAKVRELDANNRPQEIEIVTDHRAFLRMLSRLSSVPETVLRRMRPSDVNAARKVVMKLVGEDDDSDVGNSKPQPTNSFSAAALIRER